MSAKPTTAARENGGDLDFARWERLLLLRTQVVDAVGAQALSEKLVDPGTEDRALEEIWDATVWEACGREAKGLPGEISQIEASADTDLEQTKRTIKLLAKHMRFRLIDRTRVGEFRVRMTSIPLDDLVDTADRRETVEEAVIYRDHLAHLAADAKADGPSTSRYVGGILSGSKNEQDRRLITGLTPTQYKQGRTGSIAVFAQLRERMSTILLLIIPAAVLRRLTSPDTATASTTDAAVVASGAGGGAAVAMKVGAATAVATASLAGATQVPKLVEKSPPARVQVSKAAPTMKRAMDKSTVTLRSASSSSATPKARVKSSMSTSTSSKRKATKRKTSSSSTSKNTAPAARQEFSAPTYTGQASRSSTAAAPSAAVPTYTPPKAAAPTAASKEFAAPTNRQGSATAAASEFQ